jgi:hypothetical protein
MRIGVGVSLAVLLGACGVEQSAPDEQVVFKCKPGDVGDCVCPGTGLEGVRVCLAATSEWSPCSCEGDGGFLSPDGHGGPGDAAGEAGAPVGPGQTVPSTVSETGGVGLHLSSKNYRLHLWVAPARPVGSFSSPNYRLRLGPAGVVAEAR